MLISVLMLTGGRRRFIPQALKCFAWQKDLGPGEELELIVVDDGEDPVADLMPPDPRVRYFRSEQKLPLRQKRQMSATAARGDIMVLWDDDDWHGPERIARQVRALKAGHGCSLLDPILFHDLANDRTWQWSARGRYQMCVGTLAFTRRYFELVPGGFPAPFSRPSDQQFVSDRPWGEVVYVNGKDQYIAVRHDKNTSDCVMTPGGPWSEAPSVAGRLLLER